MEIKVGGKVLHYNSLNVSLRFDAIDDSFEIQADSDFTNPDNRVIFAPLSYQDVTLNYTNSSGKKELVMLGTITAGDFSDFPHPTLDTLKGNTKTYILGDCQIVDAIRQPDGTMNINFDGAIQHDGLTLTEIAVKVISPFGLSLVVDQQVKDECDKVFGTATATLTQTVESYLAQLCNCRNVVLSHTADGKVLLTNNASEPFVYDLTPPNYKLPLHINDIQGVYDNRALINKYDKLKIDKVNLTYPPIGTFNPKGGNKYVSMKLEYDARKMHSHLHLVGQAGDTSNVTDDKDITNPYVTKSFRFKREIQRAGSEMDTPQTARMELGNELAAVKLKIELEGWELNGKLIRPNNLILVENPDIYIFNKTYFFIESVSLYEDAQRKTAILNCVLPTVYNNQAVKRAI